MKTIAVVFGGRSTEHDVSIVTAISSIIKPLKMAGCYDVEPIYISKDGKWYWGHKLSNIAIYQDGEIEQFMRKAPNVHLLFDNGLTLVKSSQFAGRKAYKKIDVVFPALHGTYGEDGSLAGVLRMANVPFVGCDMPAGVLAMDKVLSKQLAESEGLLTAKYVHLTREEYALKAQEVLDKVNSLLSFPMFVKPAHLGSSIGISRVENPDQLANAIELACYYDDKVLVEEAVNNLIEVTLPILGNDELRFASVEQPVKLADGKVFDFDSKYMGQGGKSGAKQSGAKQGSQGYSKIPADIFKELYDECLRVGGVIYKALGCSGIARVDMLIDTRASKVYFNEVNPLPGSLYVHNWRASGLSNVELVEELIHLAEQKHKKANRSVTSFDTSFLRQF